jgi:hypothetical protein
MVERHGRALAQLVRRATAAAGDGNAEGLVALRDAPALADLLAELGARIGGAGEALDASTGAAATDVYLPAAADLLLLLREPLRVAPGELETARQASALQEGLSRLVCTIVTLLEPTTEDSVGQLRLPPFRLVAAALAALGEMAATLERWPRVTPADALLATVARTEEERVEAMTASACVGAGLPTIAAALLSSLFASAHLDSNGGGSGGSRAARLVATIPGTNGIGAAAWKEAQLLALRLAYRLALHQETARALAAVSVPQLLLACLAAEPSLFDCLGAVGGLAIDTLWAMLDSRGEAAGGLGATAAASLAASLTQGALRSMTMAPRSLRELTLDVLRQPVCARHAVMYLRRAIMQAESQAERAARNDALALVALLASDADGMQRLMDEAHLPETLARFCACADVRMHHPDVRGLRFSNSEEDFELLKLGLVTLCKFAGSDAAVVAMASVRIVELILSYLQPDFAAGAEEVAIAPANSASGARRASSALPRRWTLPQFEELQLLALSTLNALLPHLAHSFVEQRGVTKLLSLLYWALDTSHMAGQQTEAREFRGAGNAFHATGDFSHSRAMRGQAAVLNNGRRAYAYWALRTLCTLSRGQGDGANAAQQDLIDQGLLQRLQDYLRFAVPDEADEMFLKVRAEALRLCGALCKGRPEVQLLFGAEGAAVLVPYLQCDPALMEGQAGRKQLQLAALDASWSCLVGCDLTERAFLELQGVFILLDVLERCPQDLHSLTLGILMDLCEGDAALQHALAWQGQHDVRLNVVHLLLRVWRDACASLGCEGVAADGIVSTAPVAPGEAWAPLAGRQQREAMAATLALKAEALEEGRTDVVAALLEPGAAQKLLTQLPSPHSSPALQDAMQNVRAKVHGLCCLFGFQRCYELVEAADRLTLAGVEEYLNLKAGEVWQEIQAELEAEGMQLVEVRVEGVDTGDSDSGDLSFASLFASNFLSCSVSTMRSASSAPLKRLKRCEGGSKSSRRRLAAKW